MTTVRGFRIPSLGTLMLCGMLLGGAAGLLFGEAAVSVAFLGDVFIRLLMLAAVPLVFCNIALALAAARPAGGLGRLAVGALAFFAATSVLAHLVALAVVGLLRPGAGFPVPVAAAPPSVPAGAEFLAALVPGNVLGVFVDGRITGILALGLMLGAATRVLEPEHRDRAISFFRTGAALFRKLTTGVMWYGPVGVAALSAAALGAYGQAVFGPLGLYLLAVWAAQTVVLGSYLGILRVFSNVAPVRFLRWTATVWTTTISTCSSLASLGASFQAAERMRLPPAIPAFTLPLGAQLNKDGSSILLGGIVLFTAQASGVSLDLSQLVAVVGIGVLLSASAPGVPNGGVVNQLLLLQVLGLPLDIAVLVAGVYRLVDMPTTTLNILGDLVGSTVLAARAERRG